MPAKSLTIFLFLCFHFSNAQYFSKEKELINQVATAKNEQASIKSLGELAEFYYLHRAETKGDSVLQKQIFQAELSNDKNVALDALFGNIAVQKKCQFWSVSVAAPNIPAIPAELSGYYSLCYPI